MEHKKEHMLIAEGCREVFIEQFPTVSEALGWPVQTGDKEQ